jgi:2-polyprenyl-3-methyl-5-hydroxy-6-metoxy-1,4-benzoquinol methylase
MPMPSDLDARLVEAARMDRYLWAGPLCSGKRVLDAGCGLAQGSAPLIRSGALEVVGVDSAEAIVEAARAQAPAGVHIEHADILNLPFGSEAFDVVVCFDVIEHTEEPLEVLAALINVLGDDGMLLLSCSSGARTGSIPSKVLVADLEALLRRRFSTVAIFQQADWVVTAVVDGQTFTEAPSLQPSELTAYKLAGDARGAERSTIMVATNGPAVAPHRTAVIADTADAGRWRKLWDAQEAMLAMQRLRIEELERAVSGVSALRGRLLEAEQALTTRHLKQFDELREHVVKLEREIESMTGSQSWRITAPLRIAGLMARRLFKAVHPS